MRFQTDEDAFRVLHDLARDVATRAEHAHCQAQDRITLRVLVRRPGAATPRKTLGHGVVDVTNRSCPLPRREAGSLEISMKTNQAAARSTTKLATKSTKSTKTTTSTTATRDPEVLFAAAKEGFLALGLSVGEVRGVGIVLPRLVHDDDLDSGVEDEGEGEDEECRDLAPGGRRVGRRDEDEDGPVLLDDPLARDPHVRHLIAVSGVDDLRDRVVKRVRAQATEVEGHEICALARDQ